MSEPLLAPGTRSSGSRGVGIEGEVALPDARVLGTRIWPGKGAPLVLLHGLLDCSFGWKRVAAATHRPCVAIDLPGFGRSAMPSEPSIASYAWDIINALAALGLTRFALIGHSLGGAVAAAVAEQEPGRVTNLTLLAPVGFGVVPAAEFVQRQLLGAIVRRGLPLALSNPLSAAGIYMLTVSGGRLPDRELLKRVGRRAFSTAPGALAANEAIVTAGTQPGGLVHRPLRYPGRVSVLWGSNDRLVPVAHTTRVREAIPQAEVTIWQGMAHHPQHERPAELNTYLAATTAGPTAVNHTRRPHRSDETSSSLATRRLSEMAKPQPKRERTAA